MLGHGSRAFDLFRKTCPIYLEDISEIHKTEPYVYCQMIAGRDAARPGEGKNSWLTGTAAWTFTSMSQYILGIRPTMDGLCIDPCIPSEWNGFTCTRKFRGSTYNITIENPDHVEKGIASVIVNGQPACGNVLPPAKAGSTLDVKVVMGE